MSPSSTPRQDRNKRADVYISGHIGGKRVVGYVYWDSAEMAWTWCVEWYLPAALDAGEFGARMTATLRPLDSTDYVVRADAIAAVKAAGRGIFEGHAPDTLGSYEVLP